jgi:hypothetical protein
MPVCSRLLFVLLISLCAMAQAFERRYLASLEDSQWTLIGGAFTNRDSGASTSNSSRPRRYLRCEPGLCPE